MQRAVSEAVKASERRGKSQVVTVSHTLAAPLWQRLRVCAFQNRLSESAVIEYAVEAFFASGGDDAYLAEVLRRAGYGLKRRT